MKRIIISGATSMIGTALTQIAVRNGVEVYALIRNNSSRNERIISSPLVHIINCSLDELEKFDWLPLNCDVFYHLAWAGTAKATRDEPEIHEKNIKYTLDAVKLAKKAGCRRFVGAGSQAEYGPAYEMIDDKTKFAPTISYGIAKYAAGIMSRKLCEKYGMDHVWGRVFSVYGPHDNEGTMLDYAIKSWDQGNVAQFSSGLQLWNYLYESDAGEMFYRLGFDEIKPDTYLIANHESFPLKSYIEIMMKVYGEKAQAHFDNNSQVVLPALNVDISKTLSALQYFPMVNFEDGIKLMISMKSSYYNSSLN